MSAQVTAGEVESALHAELEPGERLLWSAQPARGLRLRYEEARAIPVCLLCSWPLLRSANSVLSSDLPAGVRFVAATPLALLAAFLVIGRFFFDARLRAKTYYGLTSRRILIVSEAFVRRVKALDLCDLGRIRGEPCRGGFGTISFECPALPASRRGRRLRRQFDLEMLTNPDHAAQQIHSARQARCAPASPVH